MGIKAIETLYRGCRFRSRLEARWATFFDALGINWQYELEGFEKNGEKYLPDFFLPETETWVEVKGSPKMLAKDGTRLGHLLDYGSPLPGFDDSSCDDSYGKVRGLLILFDIPYVEWGIVLHPIITHHKGLDINYVMFVGRVLSKISDGELSIINMFTDLNISGGQIDGCGATEKEWLSINQHSIPTGRAFPQTIDAYQAAR